MGARRNSTEISSQDTPRSGPEVENRNSVKDGAPERLRCGTIQKEVNFRFYRRCPQALQEVLSFNPALVRGQENVVSVAVKLRQLIAGEGQFL